MFILGFIDGINFIGVIRFIFVSKNSADEHPRQILRNRLRKCWVSSLAFIAFMLIMEYSIGPMLRNVTALAIFSLNILLVCRI